MRKKDKLKKIKEKREKARRWQKKNRENLRRQGIRIIQVYVPEESVDMIRAMCGRMTARHLQRRNPEAS